MNLIEIQSQQMNVDANVVMDVLQNYGVVSDCCLNVKDVHPKDQSYAVVWIKRNKHLVDEFLRTIRSTV